MKVDYKVLHRLKIEPHGFRLGVDLQLKVFGRHSLVEDGTGEVKISNQNGINHKINLIERKLEPYENWKYSDYLELYQI